MNYKVKKDNKNENDPYDFFKFEGPVNNDDNKKNPKKNNGKKGFPLFGVMILVLAILVLAETLFMSKDDKSIPYSQFITLIENGEIVSVEISENLLIGYGPEIPQKENSGARGIVLFKQNEVNRQVYKTNAVLMEKFITFKLIKKLL